MVRSWKKLLAVGCSHGDRANGKSLEAVLRFRKEWKPDTVIHLGDFVDTTAFRSGAKGTSDESKGVAPDIECGLDFLRKLRPNVLTLGNHEWRLWRLAGHYNAIVAGLAVKVIGEINDLCASMKCEVVQDEWKRHKQIANYKFFHGWYFNENACRDHAEAFGNCVFAHTHRTGMQKGRRDDSPTGYCVGTLCDIPAMDYASSRRATLGWSSGFVWGVYTNDRAVLWLHEQPEGLDTWVLPTN